jgi:hypothetical protein
MYDTVFERMEKTFQVSRMVRMSVIFGVVINAILGLIIAAFLKKDEDINIPA